MRGKCQDRCPHCTDTIQEYGEGHHRVYPKRAEPHNGLPQCSTHGCVLVDGEWTFECVKCGEQPDKLYGMWLPTLCKSCYDAALARQRAAGNVCGICGAPRMVCCC